MMIDPKTWLRWARLILNPKRADWLRAMEAELFEIPDAGERSRFGFGCFTSVLHDAARSRRGLNYIARGLGAFLILVMSVAGVWMMVKLGKSPETFAASRLVIGLCLFYLVSAGLLIVSLRYLQIYAKLGLVLAVSGWAYCALAKPSFETLQVDFLSAISVEMAGFMIGLFIATIYLNWLYNPEACDDW